MTSIHPLTDPRRLQLTPEVEDAGHDLPDLAELVAPEAGLEDDDGVLATDVALVRQLGDVSPGLLHEEGKGWVRRILGPTEESMIGHLAFTFTICTTW